MDDFNKCTKCGSITPEIQSIGMLILKICSLIFFSGIFIFVSAYINYEFELLYWYSILFSFIVTLILSTFGCEHNFRNINKQIKDKK